MTISSKLNMNKLIIISFILFWFFKLLSGYSIYILDKDITFWGRFVTVSQYIIILILFMSLLIKKRMKTDGKSIKLLASILMYFFVLGFTNLLNDGVFSQVDFCLIIIVMLLFLEDISDEVYLKIIEISMFALFLFCLFSSVFMFLGKGIVDYNGILPFRLKGLTPHANGLGSIAATLILGSLCMKKKLYFLVGMFTLLCTQSKTCIGAVGIGFIVYLWNIILSKKQSNIIKVLLCLTAFILLIIVFQSGYTITFTGRLYIWRYWLSAWGTNLHSIFIGSSQTSLINNYSENQFIQSLCKNGLIGLITLLFMIAAMVKGGLYQYRSGNKFALMMLTLIGVRLVTESIFSGMVLGDAFTLYLISMRNLFVSKNDNI